LLSDFDEVRMEREQDELTIDTGNRLDMRLASQCQLSDDLLSDV